MLIIDGENFLEFVDGLGAEAHVLVRGRAGNILAGISGGQIEAGVHQTGIEVLGLLEKLDSGVVLGFLESGDTFIEAVPGCQFVAAGDARSENHERSKGGSAASEANGPRPSRVHPW